MLNDFLLNDRIFCGQWIEILKAKSLMIELRSGGSIDTFCIRLLFKIDQNLYAL